MGTIFILISLFIKHFVVDFLLQPPYMYKNKGTLLHPGGWLHAGLHGWVTWWILVLITDATGVGSIIQYSYITIIAIMEILIHYIMDYIKVNVVKAKGYTPTTHEEWFTWFGIDQTVHSLTYILIAAMML